MLWGERIDLPESERRKAYDKAKAFVQAIVITLGAHGLTGPTTPYTPPYLGGCPRLQPDDEKLAREVLGIDADRILGEAPRSTSTHRHNRRHRATPAASGQGVTPGPVGSRAERTGRGSADQLSESGHTGHAGRMGARGPG